jgi:hypothetical protein
MLAGQFRLNINGGGGLFVLPERDKCSAQHDKQ